MRGLALSFIYYILLSVHTAAQPFVLFHLDFENGKLEGFQPFHARAKPDVAIVAPGARDSGHSLRGQRSDSGGWTALSRDFGHGLERMTLAFDFAFSNSSGRSLNIWTHEPGGSDASQFNIAIQNGVLQQYDGRTRRWVDITRNIRASEDPKHPVWHRLRAVMDANAPGIDFWVSSPGKSTLPGKPITRAAYRTNLKIGAIDFVSGTRIAKNAWYRIDNVTVIGGRDQPAPHALPPAPEKFTLWTGPDLPSDPEQLPFVAEVTHRVIHRPTADGYKFLHGAALVAHRGVLYANWANSPVHENGPHETLQGRRSTDGGKTWSPTEVIGPGFDGPERHSHGVLFVHQNEVWTICARFGVGTPGKRFAGLQGEAFVLNPQTDRWASRGIVMENCWPYDEPVRMGNGNYITGGQDKDGLPVVAISHGNDFTRWDSVLIPYHPDLKPSFAETTVWAEGAQVLALIRGGSGTAWVATSKDHGRTWSTAIASNFPMPRAKAYLGKLSTGQLYALSNFKNRDTLVVSVGKPGALTLEKIWRVRHGKSEAPRFKGHAKSKQWSYPYGYEHEGNLYILYSIGKEECGMSVVPIKSLNVN